MGRSLWQLVDADQLHTGNEEWREWVFPLHLSLGPVLPWLTSQSLPGKHPAGHRYTNRLFMYTVGDIEARQVP